MVHIWLFGWSWCLEFGSVYLIFGVGYVVFGMMKLVFGMVYLVFVYLVFPSLNTSCFFYISFI